MKIYFDNVLIDEDAYAELTNDYKLFTDNFYLGSTASNTFKITVAKSTVSSHPSEVKITDDTNTYYLIVDKVIEEKNFYIYELVDKLVLFNFEYDASVLINNKAENEEECYLSDIWKDMCLQASVEYDETYVFENDIVVNWYDNRVQARRYLSFIAELQSGYACMLENGKQSFKKQKRASIKTIDADECSDLIIGEKKTITRVVYDGGAFKWEFGDDTGDTLYLQSDNVFIVNEQIVENIYNNLKDFEFYLLDTGKCQLDPGVRAGDVITFADGVNSYLTIAQYSGSYGGGWVGNYSLNVASKQQEETQILGLYDSVLSIKTEIDRANASFKIISEKTDTIEIDLSTTINTQNDLSTNIENITSDINDLSDTTTLLEEQTGELATKTSELETANETINTKLTYQEEKTNTIVSDIDGLKQSQTYSGGYNLLENCVKQFGQTPWTGNFTNLTNTEIKNNSLTKSALVYQNGTETRQIQVPSGIYNFSCKYKKLLSLAVCKIKINEHEIIFDGEGWQEKEHTFQVNANTIDIEFIGDTNNSLWMVDLLFIPGNIKQVWTPNPNEINTGTIKLGGDVFTIESDSAKTKFEATTDGVRIISTTTGLPTTEYTEEGTKTNKIEAKQGEIAQVTFTNMTAINQTWIKRIER